MLTAKQKTFCEEYLVDLNATQAAIRAGYSSKTAQQMGSENLSKPVIQEYIKERMDKRSKRAEIDADYVLKGIQDIVVKSVEDETYDPKSALKGYEMLGKHLKIFTDVQETKHSFTKMGSVTVSMGENEKGEEKIKEIVFDVGTEPDEVI